MTTTELHFKKIKKAQYGEDALLMFNLGEIRKPIRLLLKDDVERLIKEWKK